MPDIKKTERTEISRLKQRGTYDLESIYSILDASLVCQAGFVRNGHPVVLPMAYGRLDDKIYIHGSIQSPLLTV
jgi:hypothetical protein